MELLKNLSEAAERGVLDAVVGVALVDGELHFIGGTPADLDEQTATLLAGGLVRQASKLAAI